VSILSSVLIFCFAHIVGCADSVGCVSIYTHINQQLIYEYINLWGGYD